MTWVPRYCSFRPPVEPSRERWLWKGIRSSAPGLVGEACRDACHKAKATVPLWDVSMPEGALLDAVVPQHPAATGFFRVHSPWNSCAPSPGDITSVPVRGGRRWNPGCSCPITVNSCFSAAVKARPGLLILLWYFDASITVSDSLKSAPLFPGISQGHMSFTWLETQIISLWSQSRTPSSQDAE